MALTVARGCCGRRRAAARAPPDAMAAIIPSWLGGKRGEMDMDAFLQEQEAHDGSTFLMREAPPPPPPGCRGAPASRQEAWAASPASKPLTRCRWAK